MMMQRRRLKAARLEMLDCLREQQQIQAEMRVLREQLLSREEGARWRYTYVCTYTYIHAYVHTYIHTYIHTRIRICIHTNLLARVFKSSIFFENSQKFKIVLVPHIPVGRS